MKWILVAMVIMWSTGGGGFPTNDQRTNLLEAVSAIETNLKRAEVDEGSTGVRIAREGTDVLTTVEDAVGRLPDSTTLVTNLMPGRISEAIASVMSTVVQRHVHEDCRSAVWVGLFVGSLKHTAQVEFNEDFPKSFYRLVIRWADTKYPDLSPGNRLSPSAIEALVDIIYNPLESWTDNFIRKLDLEDLVESFFKAVSTALHWTKDSCSNSNTVTLRTLIIQLFRHGQDVKLLSGQRVCQPEDFLLQNLESLVTNIGVHLESHVVENMMSSGILRHSEINSFLDYVQENYDLPYVVQLVGQLAESGEYEQFVSNFSEASLGRYFVRIIEDITMDVAPENLIDAVLRQFPGVDLYGLHSSIAREERRHLLTSFIKHLLRQLHENCPGVALTELFLGFVNYAIYSLPKRNDLSLMFDELRATGNGADDYFDYSYIIETRMARSRTDNTPGYRGKVLRNIRADVQTAGYSADGGEDSRDSRDVEAAGNSAVNGQMSSGNGEDWTSGSGLWRNMQNTYTPLKNIYDVLYLVQKAYLDRLESYVRPILDEIDAKSAEKMFWDIENQLDAIDPNHATIYQLLQDIEGIFLSYMSNAQNRICRQENNALAQLKSILRTAVPRMLVPIRPEEIHSIIHLSGSSRNLSLGEVAMILTKLESVYLPESIIAGLIQMVDIVRSDNVHDIEQHLAEEISSIIDDIMHTTIDYYNPYEVEEPLDTMPPPKPSIHEVFQQHKDDMMNSPLAYKHPVDALSDFFMMFVEEARRQGLQTDQFLPVIMEVINSITNTQPNM